MRRLQSGVVENYFVVMVIGIAVVFVIMEILRVI